MTAEIKIKGQIQNTNDAKEIFDEVISNIEKHYEKFYGFFTVDGLVKSRKINLLPQDIGHDKS